MLEGGVLLDLSKDTAIRILPNNIILLIMKLTGQADIITG
ncbi:hypothetical protein BMS3Abin03_00491 [bacterium BMS3Abin03]|nr:hypothetical protein BMS3Abin03_00491 [bacterium BMS3Abin03]